MNFVSFELSIASLIPALCLAAYVFFSDRVDKEPIPLLALLLALGGAAYLPAFALEKLTTRGFDKLFAPFATFDLSGNATYSSRLAELGHGLLITVIGVALIEELTKWAVMFFITRKNKNFNCLFDGLVYGTFTALGFAIIENIRYAYIGGWDTLLLRSITSVPGHLYFGIIMGYFFTMWRVYKTAKAAEKEYARRGLITVTKPFRSGGWFAAMIIIPIMQHGAYALAGFFPSLTMDIIFYSMNLILLILCLVGVRKISRIDAIRGRYADAMLDAKYPQIKNLCDDVEEDLGISDTDDGKEDESHGQ